MHSGKQGIPESMRPCGGLGLCCQCNITVTGPLRSVESGNAPLQAENTQILACRWKPDGDCLVFLPDIARLEIVVGESLKIPGGQTGLGIAADIGTTTVASYLYDLKTGTRLAVESDRNAQRPFGADVISRIQYSGHGDGLKTLSTVIRNQLSSQINALCASADRDRKQINKISIAGNTVMEHIFDGLSPVGIGVAPFTTLSLFGNTPICIRNL